MTIKRSNWKAWKTTAIGLLLIAAAFYYLFVLEKESYTIFFGMLLFGVVFVLAPDKGYSNALRFFNRLLKVFGTEEPKEDKPNIDIDIQAEKNNDIPNER